MKTYWNVSIGINDKYIFIKNGNIKIQSPLFHPSDKKVKYRAMLWYSRKYLVQLCEKNCKKVQ